MPSDKAKRKGLTHNARNPSSIQNMQHHDPSASQRSITGSPGTMETVIATSTTETPLHDDALLRVVNTDAATQFIYIGENPAPVTVDASNSMALPPGHVECFYCGVADPDEVKSIVVKTSHANVQVVIMEK